MREELGCAGACKTGQHANFLGLDPSQTRSKAIERDYSSKSYRCLIMVLFFSHFNHWSGSSIRFCCGIWLVWPLQQSVASWHLVSATFARRKIPRVRLDQQSTHTTHSPTIPTPYSTDGVPCTVWTLHLQCLRIGLFSFPRALRCPFVGRSSISHAFGYGRFGYAFD